MTLPWPTSRGALSSMKAWPWPDRKTRTSSLFSVLCRPHSASGARCTLPTLMPWVCGEPARRRWYSGLSLSSTTVTSLATLNLLNNSKGVT